MVLNDTEITALNANTIGGKAKNLYELKKRGFSVPRFICVTSLYYEQLVENAGIKDEIKKINSSLKVENYYLFKNKIEKIHNILIKTQMPEEWDRKIENIVEGYIESNNGYAIRSSFGVEDGKKNSFSGMFDTYLCVKEQDIIEKLKYVLASLWTERAVLYLLKNSIPINSAKPAVIIMQMLKPDKSGVAFTCNVNKGYLNEIVINANYGLGESVVNGNIEPDEYQLKNLGYKLELLEKKKGEKKYYYESNTDNNRMEKIENVNKKFVLSNREIVSLGWEVSRVFASIGENEIPQDIEWAIVRDNIWILQTRPVTKVNKIEYDELKGQTIWTNANMKEIMPGPHSFLSWNILENAFAFMLNAINTQSEDKRIKNVCREKLFKRYPYMNISSIQYEIYLHTGIKPNVINKSIGGEEREITVSKRRTLIECIKNIITIYKYLHEKKNIYKEVDFYQEKAFAQKIECEEGKYKKENIIQLIKHIETEMNTIEKYAVIFEMVNMYAGLYVELYSNICNLVYRKKANQIINFNLSHNMKLVSSNYGTMMKDISGEIHKKYKTFILEEIKNDKEILKSVNRFIEKYGHRGLLEIDLIHKRWADDKDVLLKYLYDIKNTSQIKREEKKYNSKKRYGLLLNKTRISIQRREQGKDILVRKLYTIRLLILEIGFRIERRGLIERKEDIFFLYCSEVRDLLFNKNNKFSYSQIIKERKKKYEDLKKEKMPDIIFEGMSEKNAEKITYNKNNGILKGISISNGVVKGKIRKVNSVLEAESIQEGEILLVPVTDISWTPLFLKAKGIIMETGGYLSHGANIAREYKIPAVANIKNIMTILEDEQEVVVDGDKGLVITMS